MKHTWWQKHKWWHWFFTKTNTYPQMIPPGENGGKLLFVKNYEIYCKKCKVLWKIDGLKAWRSGESQKDCGKEEKL